MAASHSTCPHCKQLTKKIEIKQEQSRWFDTGASFLCQTVEHAQACEHCGAVFNRSEGNTPVAKLAIGTLLVVICGSVLLAVVVLLVGRVAGWW